MDHPSAPQRILFLDAMRGLAVYLVFAVHGEGFFSLVESPNAFVQIMQSLSKVGHTGLFMFFVISGFVVPLSIEHAPLGLRGFGNFVLRRSIRLDPPYWAAIAFTVAVLVVRANVSATFDYTLPSLASLFAHVFYLQSILGYTHINLIFWTLCLEIQFYLLIFATFSLIRFLIPQGYHAARSRIIFALFVLSLGWPAGIYPKAQSDTWVFYLGYAFLTGSLIYEDYRNSISKWVVPLCLGAVALTHFNEPYAITVACTGLAIYGALKLKGNNWLSRSPLYSLGKFSYSFYLVHVPVCWIGLAVANRAGWLPSNWGSVLGFFLFLGIAWGISWGFFRLIEKPCVQFSRRFKRSDNSAQKAPIQDTTPTTVGMDGLKKAG